MDTRDRWPLSLRAQIGPGGLAFFLLAFPCLSRAAIVTTYSAGKLSLDADRVVVGKTLEIEGQGHEFKLKLKLLRVLKGRGRPGEILCARLPVFTGLGNRPMPYTKKRTDQTVLMFLNNAPGCLAALPRNSYAGQVDDFTFDAETLPPPVPAELTRGRSELQLAAEILLPIPRLITGKSTPFGSFRLASDPNDYPLTLGEHRAKLALSDAVAFLQDQENLDRWIAWLASPPIRAPLELQAAVQVVNCDPEGLRGLSEIIGARPPTSFTVEAVAGIARYYRSPDLEGIHLLG